MKHTGMSIICILLLVLATACAPAPKPAEPPKAAAPAGTPAAADLLAKIKAEGQLVVGVEATFPPFESYDPEKADTIIGFDIDLVQEIADDIGVKLVVKDMEFSGIVPSVQTGKIDLAPGITKTEERAKVVSFSKEYTGSKLGVVVRADDDSIKNLNDLKQKKVSVQLGSLADRQVTAAGLTPKGYNKHDEALLNVKNKVIDAHVLDGTVGNRFAETLGGLKVIEIPELNQGVAGLSCIIAMDNASLLEQINKTIDRLEASGKMDEMRRSWKLFN